MILRWFRALMPKEEQFFDLFDRHATIVVAGAEALRGLLQGGETIEHFCREVARYESEADEVTRRVLTAVRRTFITPFDRGDIQDLTSSLDDAIDQMNKTSKTIALFEIRSFEPQMQQMGEIIVTASKLAAEAMPLLGSISRNAAQLNALTERIVQIEDQADQLHDEGRKALFLAGRTGDPLHSPMHFILGSEIYDHLESVVDRLEDVANEINALVVDHL